MLSSRPAGIHDLPGIYRVCRRTATVSDGDSGPDNPDLLGHIYAGPYVLGASRYARVTADSTGVAGYVLACADTRAFEAWAEQHWWPALREQYPIGSGSPEDAAQVALLHSPPRSPDTVVRTYPAHLHIDLLDRARGRGLGGQMVRSIAEQLRADGVAGLHLGVGSDNTNAIAFYRHLGFVDLARDGEGTIYMGLTLQ